MQVKLFLRDDGLFDVAIKHQKYLGLPTRAVLGVKRENLDAVIAQEGELFESRRDAIRGVKVQPGTP